MYNQFTLVLNGTEIPITYQYKFLDILNSFHARHDLVYNCIMEIIYKNLFENKAKAIKPFNLTI